jgi:hypothetical protein
LHALRRLVDTQPELRKLTSEARARARQGGDCETTARGAAALARLPGQACGATRRGGAGDHEAASAAPAGGGTQRGRQRRRER